MANRFVLNETSYHGAGAIGSIPDEIKARGFQKVFVASDPDLIKFGVTKKVTDLLEQGETPESLLQQLLGDLEPVFTEQIPVQYACNCSKERVTRAIASIGKMDIQEMIDDNQPIEVNCQFCDRHYIFTTEELKQLLQASQKGVSQ